MTDQTKPTPETLPLTSLDISAERRVELKRLFPGVFTESRNEAGELVESVDFLKLKAELGEFSDVFESRRERYGMDWPGKKEALKLIQQPSVATLKPCREESVNFDTTENLFIEGDNLEVLKLLQKSYYGKVKMIYIDPPYNTGKEFIYPDNFSESLETYLVYAGMVDGQGRKFSTNTANEGRFHTKWLNMMYPRLYLARNLLRDDGVIFISIDDNEVKNLRELCNEIFGEENFVAQFTWKSRKFPDSRAKTGVSTDHEYILLYAKTEACKLRGIERDEAKFVNPDNDPRGPWMSRSLLGLANKEQRPNLHYPIVDPSTNRKYFPPIDTGWRYSLERMGSLVESGCVLFPKSVDGRPREKKFRSDLQNEYIAFPSTIDDVFTADGTSEIRQLFDEDVFDFSKPAKLIGRLIEQGLENSDIVMDFFSGSGSTAHATFEVNRQSGSIYKFLLIQLPEPTTQEKFPTIAEIGKERIRRVIKKIEAERSAKAKEAEGQLPGMGEEQPELDLGFKVLKLDRSNFKVWEGAPPDTPEEKVVEQLEAHIEHIDPAATQEDILYELLLKAGFMPTERVERIELAGKTLFSISGGMLLICLEEGISKELVEAVVEAEPSQFICLDRAFHGNDQLKANAVQTIRAYNQGRDKQAQLIFRTV